MALLVQQSVACQVRVIICEQPDPLVTVSTTEMVTLLPQQISEAEGASKAQAELHGTLLLVAQVMTGGVVSTTVTVWLQEALLEQQSVACQVRVIASEHAVPLVIVPETTTVTLVPQHTSEAEGASKSQTDPHSTTLLLAQLMTGGVVSLTVTVWLQPA
jgi:hypothetical protein